MPPTMTNEEAIQMMLRCKNEIVSLRATIDRLQPKADAYENLVTVLRLLPRPGVSMGEDLAWVIDKRINELTPAEPQPS